MPAAGTFQEPGTLTDEQIAALASGCWKKRNQVIAVAVALAESSGNTAAENSCCVGLWQVNVLAHNQFTRQAMRNPVMNRNAACTIFHAAGGWQPWESFTNGRYQQFMGRAEKAVKEQTGTPGATGSEAEGLLEPFGGPHSEGALEAGVSTLTAWQGDLDKFLKFITSSSGWLRVGKVIVGAVLLVIAIDELSKLGGGPSPIGTGTKAAKKAAEVAAL